ncbi:4-hydroxybutyrate coenzyme A transferase [Carnobacterium sp. AT7]|uniref:acetyl-CoA hydrolase/transferase family protein n=1 Tax=Carnobacterium sp. AT7 TaxID=333990 RepID=UPI00015F2DC0|nr:acetyl-CoA hydrolase/transferase C-terminal domain-containing protein [Carnobacterium sp. AT7]EDP69302.1 4-hydroxybutyrate coenzyme A transferase [Carnobacterium sp. AT7]
MSFKDDYQAKIKSLAEAAAQIQSNERIMSNPVAAMPISLITAITKRYKEYENVTLYSAFVIHPFDFFTNPEVAEKIRYHSFFMGPLERQLVSYGTFSVDPVNFSNLNLLIEQRIKPTTFVTTVSEMDEEGYFNYGPMGVTIGEVSSKVAQKVIIQVNKNVPKVNGTHNKIHIDDVDIIVEQDEQLLEIPETPSSNIDKKIAECIVPHVKDGSTIQIGFGGLANAVSYGLDSKKDLAVHTEMITESMVYLTEKGVITGPIRGGFAMGTRKLYDFSGDNDQISIEPLHLVNDPSRIAQIDNFVSVNGCLMADLTGQVVSEGAGTRFISSVGGANDFVRGATKSKGGQSFICLASTNKNEKTGEVTSNIMMSFPPATPVTVPRADVQYIVTEHGIADMFNRSIEDRVEQMISIADPEFRDELRTQAITAGFIRK